MPPKSKKSSPPKRAARKVPAKSDDVIPEEIRVSDNNQSSSADLNVLQKSDERESIRIENEDEVKEDEYERGEHLVLEDNEPDYEQEESGGDYDEKELDEGYEIVEEVEEGDEVEEEGDMVEDEMDDVPEEYEGEDDEQVDASDEEQYHKRDEGQDHEHDVEKDHEHDEERGHEHNHEHTDLVDAADEHEHHEHVKERRKRKEFEIFVGGLDKDATEKDLKDVFSVAGEITEIRLMKNPQTKKNKGFAFLRFATVQQAQRAVTELKNPVVKGKQCCVSPSQDSDTLFLGNICKTWTEEKLKDKLKSYGIENIGDLTLVEDSNSEGKNRGFAVLEFPSRTEAKDAFKRLQDIFLGVERPAKVSFADSFIDPEDKIMAQVTTVFIDGLPASWDEDRVCNLLKKFGEVKKVELARNMPSARRRDFGFVMFDSHTAAVSCAKSINNTELGEGDSKAKVRARLSRPEERGRGKNHPRADHKAGCAAERQPRAPWNHPLPPRPLPARTRIRGFGTRVPVAADRSMKRSMGPRGRRPPPSLPPRARPLPPPPRSYKRSTPAPPRKSNLYRDYSRGEQHPPTSSRPVADYSSRLPPERRPSYRDDYDTRAPVYPEVRRSSASRSAGTARRPYSDDSYDQRYERPPSNYREGRPHDYDSVSGSKRSYSSLDDVPSRYSDPSHGVRHSRVRLDYDVTGSATQYEDAYGDRLGRSTAGYSTCSRSSISAQDSHGLYSSRQARSYSGSYGGSDGGVYSSSYGGDYSSRRSDVGGSSYSSMHSTRGVSGSSSSYMGGGSSGRGSGSSYMGGGSSGRGGSGSSYMGGGSSTSYY